MTLQDTRTPQQMLEDFYEGSKDRMASDIFFPVFKEPLGGGYKDGSFGIDDTPLNRQAFPEAFESRFGIAQTPRGDSVPIYFDKHMNQYAPRPFGPQQFPEYMQAGGPSLFPIKKDLPGEVKGTIRGVQGGSRNDLSKPYGGLRKAGMLFENQGLFSA